MLLAVWALPKVLFFAVLVALTSLGRAFGSRSLLRRGASTNPQSLTQLSAITRFKIKVNTCL